VKQTLTKWVFVILVVLTVGTIVFANQTIGTWGSPVCGWVGHLCHNVPYLVGFAVLLLLWALYQTLAGDWTVLETIRGVNNVNSNSRTFSVLRSPTSTNLFLSVDSKTLTLTGSGFGVQQDRDWVKINDKVSGRITTWDDSRIVFGNPDLTAITPNTTAPVKIFLDSDTTTPTARYTGLVQRALFYCTYHSVSCR
jgi:hypothetical protein